MTGFILIGLGLVIIYSGLKLIIKQDLSKVNYHQYQYVEKDDMKQFTKQSGIALIILATSFIVAGVLHFFITGYNFIAIAIGVIIYTVLLLKTQKKYNKEPDIVMQKFDNEL